jgi:isoquinoline 1-oxidoreductase alpha subunit
MATYTININGENRKIEADEDTPLLWVLRDNLNLVGTKYGCGMAQCGACTVHINGVAQRSCVLPVSAVSEAKITTIESLSKNGEHPLQQAWIEHKVPQCGFCQCGQMMQAASLLASNPTPSDDEIVQSMSGNICRCGTYPRIHKAIKSASKAMAGVAYYVPEKTGEES